MAAQSTFIKLDRNITKWRWYKNPNTFRVFIHLLITANFAPYEFENITIERGQLATSHETIANTLNLTIQEVRTALGHLKSTGEITATIYRRFQVISIVNYNSYQGDSTCTATAYPQPINNLTTGYSQQLKNNKENKEGNNKNKYNISDSESLRTEFLELWKLYPRKQGKEAALKSYIKARKSGATFEEVKIGIETYRQYIDENKTESQYIKQGSTYFNGKGWEDVYPVKKNKVEIKAEILNKLKECTI